MKPGQLKAKKNPPSAMAVNRDEPGVSLRGTGTGLDDHGLVYGP
jgi:hypothetical protein